MDIQNQERFEVFWPSIAGPMDGQCSYAIICQLERGLNPLDFQTDVVDQIESRVHNVLGLGEM